MHNTLNTNNESEGQTILEMVYAALFFILIFAVMQKQRVLENLMFKMSLMASTKFFEFIRNTFNVEFLKVQVEQTVEKILLKIIAIRPKINTLAIRSLKNTFGLRDLWLRQEKDVALVTN